MRKLLLGAFLGSSLYAQDIVGDWKGTISNPDLQVRLALHVTKTANGGLDATLDSVDQGALGLAISSMTLKGSTLKFTIAAANGTYEGKVAPGGGAIDGIWTQGEPYPLKFERGSSSRLCIRPPSRRISTGLGPEFLRRKSLKLLCSISLIRRMD